MNEREHLIYNYVRDHQPVSAQAVAQAIPSIPSVATYISRLKKEGFLSVQGNETITQSNGQVIPRSLYGIGEVVPPQEQEPSAAPTPPPTPQNDTDPIATLLHSQNSANAPQTATDVAQSTQTPTDGQFTAEDGQTLYDEILAGRRYGQIGFNALLNIITDIHEEETDPKTLVEVMYHYVQVMLGKEQPNKQWIPNKEVRQYVRTIIGDPDVQTPDQYVLHILRDRRHYKYNKQDISNTRWIKELQDRTTAR